MAFSRTAEIIHGDDVGMNQPAGRLSLAEEALHRSRLVSILRMQDLDRDLALHGALVGPVHDTHSAASDHAAHVVTIIERAAGQQGRVGDL